MTPPLINKMSLTQSITTTTKPKCHHANGWFKAVTFKWWVFDFRRKYFLCTDCQDLIPLEEADEIRKQFLTENGKK